MNDESSEFESAAKPDSVERPATGPSAPPAKPPSTDGLSVEDWALVALVALSIVGFAVPAFSPRASFQYWLVAAPFFAVVSLYTAWSGARARGDSASEILRRQVMHWLALPVAVYLIYQFELSGRLPAADAGIVVLLSIAITTYLAGVHFDWRLGLVGAALGVGALAAAIVAEYFWIVGLAALALGAVLFWIRRKS